MTPAQPSVISQKHRSQKVQHYFSQAPVRALKSITGFGSLRACQRSNWTSDFFCHFFFLLVIKRVCAMLLVLPEYETWLIKRRTGRIILQNKETNISQQPVDWLLHSLEDYLNQYEDISLLDCSDCINKFSTPVWVMSSAKSNQFKMFKRTMSSYITVDDDIIQPQIWSFDCATLKRNDGTAAGTSEKLNLPSYKSHPAVSTKYAALKCTCGALVKRKEIRDVVCITIWLILLSVAASNELDAISVKPCAAQVCSREITAEWDLHVTEVAHPVLLALALVPP